MATNGSTSSARQTAGRSGLAGGPTTSDHRRDAESGSGKLKLWPLVLGIGLLFVLGVTAFVGAIWLAGHQADSFVETEKVRQVERLLTTRAASLATTNRDWAWWNEGIEKFITLPDRAYADQNLGDYAANTFGLHATLAISPDDKPIFAYLRGRPVPDSTAVEWLAALWPLIDRTRAESKIEPVPSMAYVELQGQLVFVSATAMAPEKGTPPPDWGRPAVLVFVRAIDAGFLASVAEEAGTKEMRAVAIGEKARVVLTGGKGEPVAGLTWAAAPPSAAILRQLLPTGFVIVLFMFGVGGFIGTRLLAMTTRYRHERDAQEARLSAAMLEAQAANHAKSQFLAAMSHEIRTPLNAIIGYSEMLKLGYVGTLDDKQQQYLDSIELAGRHLLSLLQDILDLARIEAGRDLLDEEDLAVDAVISKAVSMTAPRARESGVALVIESTMPACLRADGRRLQQMVLNLLANAIRHAPQGTAVRLGWSVEPDSIALLVSDSGPGIPEQDLERVVEPFHRPTDSMLAEKDSNGLGLPLTARLMKLHGGVLLLANAPAGGLVARLQFPGWRMLCGADCATAGCRLRRDGLQVSEAG
jgi:signal transduction histidine kinase